MERSPAAHAVDALVRSVCLQQFLQGLELVVSEQGARLQQLFLDCLVTELALVVLRRILLYLDFILGIAQILLFLSIIHINLIMLQLKRLHQDAPRDAVFIQRRQIFRLERLAPDERCCHLRYVVQLERLERFLNANC